MFLFYLRFGLWSALRERFITIFFFFLVSSVFEVLCVEEFFLRGKKPRVEKKKMGRGERQSGSAFFGKERKVRKKERDGERCTSKYNLKQIQKESRRVGAVTLLIQSLKTKGEWEQEIRKERKEKPIQCLWEKIDFFFFHPFIFYFFPPFSFNII